MSDETKLSIETNSPVKRGDFLTIHVTSHESKIRRVTAWLFAPNVEPVKASKKRWTRSVHPLGTAEEPEQGSVKKKIGANWLPGTYTLVCHHPAEPGSAFPGYVQSVTVEVIEA
jgi:hypothetical protein